MQHNETKLENKQKPDNRPSESAYRIDFTKWGGGDWLHRDSGREILVVWWQLSCDFCS